MNEIVRWLASRNPHVFAKVAQAELNWMRHYWAAGTRRLTGQRRRRVKYWSRQFNRWVDKSMRLRERNAIREAFRETPLKEARA